MEQKYRFTKLEIGRVEFDSVEYGYFLGIVVFHGKEHIHWDYYERRLSGFDLRCAHHPWLLN